MNTYYLWSIGCQMNDADAARLRHGLAQMGLTPTTNAHEAALVVLITCVVRQKAEDKVIGRLSSLKNLKRSVPHAKVVVMGCFVHDEAALRSRFPFVDAFFRPSDTSGLLDYVRKRCPPQGDDATTQALDLAEAPRVSALIPISEGCDHHCTYCIVRLRRGRQRSRSLSDIVAEANEWARRGAREVTLLGQNVDAYGQDFGPQVLNSLSEWNSPNKHT